MSHAITTSGLNGGDVATEYQTGQTTREWVDAHDKEVDAAGLDGDKLTTSWTSTSGPREVVTTRWPDEDDVHFLERHKNAYLLEMDTEPPVP